MTQPFDDRVNGGRPGWGDPATAAPTPTLSDTVNDPNGPYRGLYVGTTGNLKVTMRDGGDQTFMNAPVGYHPIAVRRVWATGTTASNIVGLK
jgi:hypothetical protein